MELPQPYNLQLHLQPPQQQHHHHHHHSSLPWNFFTNEGQNVTIVENFGAIAGGQDQVPSQQQNLLYAPSCDALGLAPGPIPTTTDAVLDRTDLQINIGFEPKSKRPKERDVYENNSQVTFVDYLQPGSVSSGLRLSLGINRIESSGDSALLPLLFDEIEDDFQQQHVEMDRVINYEMEQLRQNILEKVHSSQLQAISLVEGRLLQKLRQKEAEIQNINKRNKELEDRVKQLTTEVCAWQQRAMNSENTIATLQVNLQQAYARDDDREGFGDSEVDDTATFNGPYGTRQLLTCKACRVSKACMVLHPCRHLCLCKDCESKLTFCPLCQTSKSKGLEVYLP